MRTTRIGVAFLAPLLLLVFFAAQSALADNNIANLQCVKEKTVTDKHGKKVTVIVNYSAQCNKQEYDESDQLLWVGGKGCKCEDKEHSITGACIGVLKCDATEGTCGADDLKCAKPTDDTIKNAIKCGGEGEDPCPAPTPSAGTPPPSATPIEPATPISPAEPCPSTGCTMGNTGSNIGSISDVPPAQPYDSSLDKFGEDLSKAYEDTIGVPLTDPSSDPLNSVPKATPLNTFGDRLNAAYKSVIGDYLFTPSSNYVEPAAAFQPGDYQGWGFSGAPAAQPLPSSAVGGIYDPSVVPAMPVTSYPAVSGAPGYYGPTIGEGAPAIGTIGAQGPIGPYGSYPDISQSIENYNKIAADSFAQYVQNAPVPNPTAAWPGQLGIDTVSGTFVQTTPPSSNNAWGPDPQWGAIASTGWDTVAKASGNSAAEFVTESGASPYAYTGFADSAPVQPQVDAKTFADAVPGVSMPPTVPDTGFGQIPQDTAIAPTGEQPDSFVVSSDAAYSAGMPPETNAPLSPVLPDTTVPGPLVGDGAPQAQPVSAAAPSQVDTAAAPAQQTYLSIEEYQKRVEEGQGVYAVSPDKIYNPYETLRPVLINGDWAKRVGSIAQQEGIATVSAAGGDNNFAALEGPVAAAVSPFAQAATQYTTPSISAVDSTAVGDIAQAANAGNAGDSALTTVPNAVSAVPPGGSVENALPPIAYLSEGTNVTPVDTFMQQDVPPAALPTPEPITAAAPVQFAPPISQVAQNTTPIISPWQTPLQVTLPILYVPEASGAWISGA